MVGCGDTAALLGFWFFGFWYPAPCSQFKAFAIACIHFHWTVSHHHPTPLPCIAIPREAIDRIVEDLLEKETLTGDEMRDILAQYTTIPEENLKAAQALEEAKEAVTA